MTMKMDEELGGGGDAPLLNQVIVLSDGRRLEGPFPFFRARAFVENRVIKY